MTYATDRLFLRIMSADKLALRHLADKEGETVSVVVRRLIRDELKRCGFLRIGELNLKLPSDAE